MVAPDNNPAKAFRIFSYVESIDDQIRHCRQEAARHPDWVMLDEHVYTDQAVSGVSTDGRMGLQRLIEAARAKPHRFDLVLVDDTSRLARDVVDAVRLLRELRFHDVHLYFVNQGLHSARDNADFFVAIYGATDSEYIRELGKKTHRGLEGQVLKGLSPGGLAYGYRRDAVELASVDRDGQPRRRGVRWVIDTEQAGVVRGVFEEYASGSGMAVIAAHLNARGIPSPRPAKRHRHRHDSIGAGWDVSTVRVILGNELYRGRLIWNRSRWVRDPGTRRRRRLPRPESEVITLQREDLRIVDEDLWRRVQDRRDRVRGHYDNHRLFGKGRAECGTYLLSGLLVCAECGGTLTIRTVNRRGGQRYGCSRHWRRGALACGNGLLVRRELAEGRVIRLLQERLYSPTAVARLVEKVNARMRARKRSSEPQKALLVDQRAALAHRLEALRRFVEQGDTSNRVRQWLSVAEREEEQASGAGGSGPQRNAPGSPWTRGDLPQRPRADPGEGRAASPRAAS